MTAIKSDIGAQQPTNSTPHTPGAIPQSNARAALDWLAQQIVTLTGLTAVAQYAADTAFALAQVANGSARNARLAARAARQGTRVLRSCTQGGDLRSTPVAVGAGTPRSLRPRRRRRGSEGVHCTRAEQQACARASCESRSSARKEGRRGGIRPTAAARDRSGSARGRSGGGSAG